MLTKTKREVHLPDDDAVFSVTVGSGLQPEHMQVTYRTEDKGDNGSRHELVLKWGAGEYVVEPLVETWGTMGVRLKMNGDWEQAGLLDAFIALGEHLRVYRGSRLKNLIDP